MSTFTQLEQDTQRLLDDTTAAIYSTASIRTHLETAELLVAISRGVGEVTGDLTLSDGVPIYAVHSTFTDWIIPLRITVSGRVLRPAKLATIAAANSAWWTNKDTPEYFFSLGATLLGFYPVPSITLTAKCTYLAVPPTGQSGSASPIIPDEFHRLLPHYSASILFATEGDSIRAQEEMVKFLEGTNIPRDSRFLPNNQGNNPASMSREVEPIRDS